MTATKIYVVDGLRTPFLRARGKPGEFSAAELAVAAARPLLARILFVPKKLDEVIVGCVIPAPDETNIARIIDYRTHPDVVNGRVMGIQTTLKQ